MPSDHTIPLSVPVLTGNEWTYVKDCLESKWLSSAGPFVDRFEAEFAARLGIDHAVATVNGTAALHVALQVVGVRPGDVVLVSDLTFIAPVNAIRYLGAEPVLVDAAPDTWQMDVDRVAAYLDGCCERTQGGTVERATGRRVKAVLPVYILGHPVDMEPLLALARTWDLVVVEDATEALGARYRGRPAGTLGHIACFSFNGNKVITTGGGGMIATPDPALASQARHLTTQAKADPVEYVHDAVGYNYRLPNVLAALGCAQLEDLDNRLVAKRRIADHYAKGLAGIDGLSLMTEAPWAESACWLSAVRVDGDRFGMDSRALLARLASDGIQARPLWEPMHRSVPHRSCRVLGGGTADRLFADALSLPSSPDLTPDAQDQVIAAVRTAENTVRSAAAEGLRA